MCDLRTQNGVLVLALVITFWIFLCTKLPGKKQKLKLLNIKYETENSSLRVRVSCSPGIGRNGTVPACK
jgi:hypothetical protein